MILEEGDSVALSRAPVAFHVDGEGSYFIADNAGGRVLQFARTGRLVAVFGRKGDGPGEFRSVGPATLLHGNALAQLALRRVDVFDRASGRFRQSIPLAFAAGDIVTSGNQLLLPLAAPATGYAVGVVPLAALDSSSPSAEPIEASLIQLPAEYRRLPGLDIFMSARVAALGDTLIAGFGGLDYLVLYSAQGSPRDTLYPPAIRRRGVPRGDDALYRTREFATYEQRMAGRSSPARIWTTPDGHVLTYHRDVTIEQRANDFAFKARAWISLLDLEGSRACPDVEVPFPGTDWPSIAYRGTSLYALDQTMVDGSPPQVRSVIRRYELAPAACRWIDMKHKESA